MNSIQQLTVTDYEYLHKRLKFYPPEYQFLYVDKCLDYLATEIQRENYLVYTKEDYLFILSCIDDLNVPILESKKDKFMKNVHIILEKVSDIYDEEIYDIRFVK